MKRADFASFSSVESDVLSGNALLWLVWDDPVVLAAVVTQLIVKDDRKICVIMACGGEDAQKWVHLIQKIEAYARAEGCESVKIIGRKGWMRLLPDYSAEKIMFEKRL